jgi:L-threonylcarbamoyladenylate synthase
MIYLKSDFNSAEIVAECLLKGGIAVLPTDTVYGFSGIVPSSPSESIFKTDEKIRKIKGRSETKPFIRLIAQPDEIKQYTNDIIPQNLLARWPGALTIIVNDKNANVTTAYRCPGDEWIRTVIRLCGCPVYSTSVNRSGSPVLDTITTICKEFEHEVDLIVDDGDKKNALPSTIVSIRDGKIVILRQGSLVL